MFKSFIILLNEGELGLELKSPIIIRFVWMWYIFKIFNMVHEKKVILEVYIILLVLNVLLALGVWVVRMCIE